MTTIPSSSTIGTALIPLSEKICTTSKTLVFSVAVARGKYLSEIPNSVLSTPPVPVPDPPPSLDIDLDLVRFLEVVEIEGRGTEGAEGDV